MSEGYGHMVTGHPPSPPFSDLFRRIYLVFPPSIITCNIPMSSNNSPTGNNAPRPDNPNVAAPPLVPALPGPAADDADDDELIVPNGDNAGSVSSGESQNPLYGITPRNVFSPPVSPQPSNDGSRMLDDDEIPNADEFD